MQYTISLIDTVYEMVIHPSVSLVDAVLRFLPFRYTPLDTTHQKQTPSLPAAHTQSVRSITKPATNALVPNTMRGKHTVMYAAAHETNVYKNPTIAFDSCVATIPYGSLVLVVELSGRFCKVLFDTHEGWVLKDDLADRASAVYPEFHVGQENSVDHPNTARVRAYIHDVFGLAHSEFSLQAGEYVLYKLGRRGVTIPWPEVRPRVPGSWHKILRGIPGIHVGVVPKVGSIMEYVGEHDLGHVAYVEAVFPDNTITISEVNMPHGGMFNERALTHEVWKGLRPVFIDIQS